MPCICANKDIIIIDHAHLYRLQYSLTCIMCVVEQHREHIEPMRLVSLVEHTCLVSGM